MPSGFVQTSSDLESIVGIQFSIFSPDEIERRSVVEITSQATYEGNEPKIGGLFDPRMGVLDNGKICRSCGQTNHGCPGHFGHYRLTRPVYYIQFMPIIMNVLKCICIRCSKLLIDKDLHKAILTKKGEARWREVLTICSNISRCGQENEDGCGAPTPSKYTREGIARIRAHYADMKKEQDLEVEYVHRLFRRITDEDVDFMGFSRFWCRPDWMICTVLPIPPPQVRPSVVQDNNQRSEDDLTHKLFEIIKNDKTLQQKIENNASKSVIDEWTNVLQYHIATLVDNQIPGVAPSAQRSGRPLKSIQQRLGSKEGRIRYNIQGKRVEFSARSVITPDPNISIGELGVPIEIASNLTYPERVTAYNRDKLYKLIQNGADKYPGAKTIVRSDGRMISLKHINAKDIVLYNGDIVNRHLLDDDILLFNRQPTLHKMSMMAHKVKVLPYKTFRLNVLVTRPYNADFDGDEMNAHIPQSEEAAVELEEIAAIPQNIVTPRHAKPLIGVFQDTLVGSYRLTRPGNEFTRREFMNLMMNNKRFDGTIPAPNARNGTRFTGQQVLSQLLPPLNMEMGNKSFDSEKDDKKSNNFVRITQGTIEQGIVDTDIYMKPGKGIIHVTYNDYGPKETVDLLDSLQTTISNYLVMNGFSVGISDLVADEDTKTEIAKVIQERKKQIEQVILQVHTDLFDNNTGKTNQQEFEDQVYGILNKANGDAGKAAQASLSTENRLVAMVKSGSKGDSVNIAQMIACLGQQAIEGKRIAYGFTDRTLPHFKKYDDSAEARGFIESSFIRGLTPQEFFFHAMSGREGLIDTAVKTAETGYIQRQLIKAMEDLVVQHDGTVRDAKMNIVQYYYGEDSVMATKLESQGLPLGKLTHEAIRKEFGMSEVDWTTVLEDGTVRGNDTELVNAYVEQIIADQRMLIEGVFQSNSLDSGSVNAPVNLVRLILNLKIRFGLKADTKTTLTPEYILTGIEKVIAQTRSVHHRIWTALLRFHLAPHKLILKERFTKNAFDMLCELIVVNHMKSWVQPGEQVGIVAAQSIGEPSTQMTLNSVDWDTRIMIAKNGRIITPQIGEFIDNYAESVDSTKIQRLPNSQIYIPLDDGNDWKAISPDENGKMMWTKLEAITRHPVINEDGTDTILEVTLNSGRVVKATKAKSFLTCVNNKLVDTNGSDLRIGDKIPLASTLVLDQIGILKSISLREILPATEWLYGTDVEKALSALNGDDRHWFQKNNGKLFTIPYSRSDSFREAFVDGKNTNTIKPGCVYPKRTRPDISHIPEEIPLNSAFGFFAGAYLAEGMANDTQVCITNNDDKYLDRVNALMDAWNVGTHRVKEARHCEKTGIKGTTSSIIIHSTLLATVMQKFFGRVSCEKAIPDFAFQAPDEFVAGIVDGYISGDGTVDKKSGRIMATSVSKELLTRFSTLLLRYGIYSNITSNMPSVGVFQSVRRNYTLNIPAKYSRIFSEKFTLSSAHKQDMLVEHFITGSHGLNVSQIETFEDIICDTVKEIKEIKPMKEWVYDVTVETTRNFMTDLCILCKDTFHLAGVASKSNVTRGVPRLRELLKITKNPKAVSLTIYLKPEYRQSKEKASEVVQDLELTLLRNITQKVAIFWDPTDEASVVEDDREIIKFFRLFEESDTESAKTMSKWILRLELNREEMFNKNISMADVAFVIKNQYIDSQIIYNDYNSDRLVMRIRLTTEDDNKSTAVKLDDFTVLKKFQNKLLNNTVIRGIPGIKAVTFRKDNQKVQMIDGKYEPLDQHILDTDGSNFIKVANHPAVDPTRLYTTNVHDVMDILGLEAVRAILISEMNSLFESVGLNYRHLGILCDVITRTGRLMSIDRYGINKNDIGPLAKMSFEETEKITLKAALFGEVDPVTGVSANEMTGQPFRGGTSFSQIMLDEAVLMKLNEGIIGDEEDEQEEDVDIAGLITADSGRTIDPCSSAQFQVSISMPPIVEGLEEPDVEIDIIEDSMED